MTTHPWLSLQIVLATELFSRSFADYTHVTFVNNAQTVHPIGTIDKGMDPAALARAMQLNIASPMFLTSEFLRTLKDPTRAPSRAAVVNVSSLWATEAAASFGVYAASKAAMEMFYEVSLSRFRSFCRRICLLLLFCVSAFVVVTLCVSLSVSLSVSHAPSPCLPSPYMRRSSPRRPSRPPPCLPCLPATPLPPTPLLALRAPSAPSSRCSTTPCLSLSLFVSPCLSSLSISLYSVYVFETGALPAMLDKVALWIALASCLRCSCHRCSTTRPAPSTTRCKQKSGRLPTVTPTGNNLAVK